MTLTTRKLNTFYLTRIRKNTYFIRLYLEKVKFKISLYSMFTEEKQ